MLGLRHARGLVREQRLAVLRGLRPARRWLASAPGPPLGPPRPQPKLGAPAGSEAARAAQALASELYGLGKVRRVPGKGELERLDAEVALRAADMSSKSLSLTLWAYARLRRVPADTSRAQLDAAVGIRLGKFNAGAGQLAR